MKQYSIRIFDMLTGLFLYALGIIISLKANVGYAPWEVFHVGLADTIGLSLGITTIIAGIVIVIIVTLLGEKLGLGTISSMLLTGVFIDIILLINIIPAANNKITGFVMLIIGLFIISVGSYFYIKSGFGAGPRDNLMVVLARKTRIPVGICRFIIELLVTLIGWKLGGMVWIGTVISVAAIGFCIQITFRMFRFDVTSVKHESLTDTYTALFGKKSKETSTNHGGSGAP